MDPIAITGFGMVSPLGIGRKAVFSALAANAPRVFGASEVLDRAKVPDACVAEVRGFDPKSYLGDKGLRNFDRLTKMMIVAGKHALEDAGIKRDDAFIALDPARIGICSATAYGSLEAITELKLVAETEDPRYINPARFPNTVINAAAGYVSIWENLRGPNVTIVDGNAGGLDAVLTCATHLAHERADAFLVGGAEVLSEALYVAFQRLGVIAPGPPLGSSLLANGLLLGESAAFLVMERLHEARARKQHVLAQVVGYGTAFEPPESEALIVNASARAVARAIANALDDAGIEPSSVDLIVGSAGGIEAIDRAEHEAIDTLFGPDVPVITPKALFGETMGAAGAVGMCCACAWLNDVPAAPLLSGRSVRPPKVVVVTAVGFYGNVSAVVLQSP